MEVGLFGILLTVFLGGFWGLDWVLRRINRWIYEGKLGDEALFSLPPGDLGWPFIGNMWSFLRAFKSSNPDSFINNFVARFGNGGVYKTVMFGRPSIIVTTPESCRRVLTDDESFVPGWPTSTMKLIGEKSFIGISAEEHKRLRKLTAAPVNGHEALSIYLKYIEENVVKTLEKWADMGQIEFLTELRRLTFRIIMHIFLSSESEQVLEALETEYTTLNYGVRAMAINLPGFAYHSALKNNPDVLEKAKAEQEEFVKNRPLEQKGGLSLKEIRQMDYLSKVIDETLRVVTFSFVVFREATKDVNISGYTIPKGWRVLVWFRGVHLDSEVYPDPMKFNPSRWDNFTAKAGTFLPFGGGGRLCPGNDLAKLEISIFLHYFILYYKLERKNPACPVMYLPHQRPKDNCLGRISRIYPTKTQNQDHSNSFIN